MKDISILPIKVTKELSKKERQKARIRIEEYHKKKLADLQRFVYDSFAKFYREEIDAFELDHIIHVYHKQSQELFVFINNYYPSNRLLPVILALIDAEEKGEWSWKPRTKQTEK